MFFHNESGQAHLPEHQRRRFWQTPAVRHLAWLCEAPSLVACGPAFSIADHLPEDVLKRLLTLDQHPEPLLAHLENGSSRRLGHYFESLYHYALASILEWPVVLRNTPIRNSAGRTLGELDFVVCNPLTGQLEHIEVAVKFYLGFVDRGETMWFGPNAHDRLDLKTRRMMDHQCRMTERAETKALLGSRELDSPITPAMALPGNLFYPMSGPQASAPCWANADHERGYWLRHSDLASIDTDHWIPLRKPHWLGPCQTSTAPEPALVKETLAAVIETNRPRLFAKLEARADGQGYEETERYFVVPEIWPTPPPT
ncbi:MAG: DUF1853 family protein [Marinobacter sp.]|uniref:DUF1853 family protein n=1 Tax=Marinobacter sp. TaxID=50741 RepID=UPI0034A07645